MILKALRPILYRSTQYGEGDNLPADDPQMVEAWVDAGSAGWADEDEPKAEPAKAEPEEEAPKAPEAKPEKKRKAPAAAKKKGETK